MLGRPAALVCVVVLLGVSACGPPIGTMRVSGRVAYRLLTANALSGGRPSEWTRNTLNSWGLIHRFDEDPEAALRELHAIAVSGRGGGEELFALGELSFLHADASDERAYYFAAAVYSWAFLFPTSPEDMPGELDPRTRLAADLYNRALTLAFASGDGDSVELAAGTYPLPFGTVDVTMDAQSLDWGDRRLVDFVPIAEFSVWGLRNRHRLPGIGAPLAARAVAREGVSLDVSLIAPYVRVAATALLRLDDVRHGLASGRLRGALELYTANDAETVVVNGRTLPLEVEETATVAGPSSGDPPCGSGSCGGT